MKRKEHRLPTSPCPACGRDVTVMQVVRLHHLEGHCASLGLPPRLAAPGTNGGRRYRVRELEALITQTLDDAAHAEGSVKQRVFSDGGSAPRLPWEDNQ